MAIHSSAFWSLFVVVLAHATSAAHAAKQQQQQQQQDGSVKPIPPLKPGQKPNFIMILTDDVGWDDLSFHNPRVNTPNIQRFRQRSTVFENFYTSPQCAQSRAQFLTGRSFARTGTMMVSGGWDFINREEVTIGEAMAAGGYRTAHFGKWHNMQVLGYEPWHNGFEDGYIPPPTGSDGEGLARVNGRYEVAQETGHVYDKVLRNRTIEYLDKRAKDKQPFFVFLAARAIHTNYMFPNPVTGVPDQRRIVPDEYRSKFNGPDYDGVADSTKDAWAFMEYLDDALGPLFDFISSSGLDQNTFVMFTGDNGAAIYPDEVPLQKKLIRMPSGLAGAKHYVTEGGIRNALTIQGPGVKPGATDNTMIAISDIFPTMVDIAGVNASVPAGLPLDGISFKSALLPSNSRRSDNTPASINAAAGGSEPQQQSSLTSRYFFMLGKPCWYPNSVPDLGPDRNVVRPQQLLDYHIGGLRSRPGKPGKGFKRCIVVRYRNYKWLGSTGKVYQFANETQHLEDPQHEVTSRQGRKLAAQMAAAAEAWWQTIIKEPHSFLKPTFYLGMGNWTVTNMLSAGAHERTLDNVSLIQSGTVGFRSAGDSMCFKLKVLTAGTYTVTAFYTSNIQATFKLSVGSYTDIKAGTARRLTVQWPAQAVMRGMLLGNLTLPVSKEGEKTEACLQLLPSPTLDGNTAVFNNFANLQWTLVSSTRSQKPGAAVASSIDIESNKNDNIQTNAAASTAAVPVAIPAPGLDLAGGYSWLHRVASRVTTAGVDSTQQDAWTALRLRHAWPGGQSVLESMFSPYDSEGIDECSAQLQGACTPPI